MARRDSSVVSRTLPENIVGKILAMVPFPFVFKTRVLSKSWKARFWSVASQDDEEKKRLAISFQKQMSEYFTKWRTLGPVFVSREDLVAFDRDRIPLPFSLSENDPRPVVAGLRLQGALVFVNANTVSVVGNISIQTWKQLPNSPDRIEIGLSTELVSQPSSDSYKLIELHKRGGPEYLALIYDSKLGSWSTKRLDISRGLKVSEHGVYLNGILYWLVGRNDMGFVLLAFNVKEETFTTPNFAQ